MISLCRLTIIIFAINIVLMSYTAYVFFVKFNNQSSDSIQTQTYDNFEEDFDEDLNIWSNGFIDNEINITKKLKKVSSNETNNEITVEIWSKAAIGLYLWLHIIKGTIDKKVDANIYLYGFKKINNFKFKFRSGPVLTTNSLEQFSADNLILVLNGRDKEKVGNAIDWLKAIDPKVKKTVKNVGLVVLGDEECHNSWINPYLVSNGGPVKFVFIVYDWKQVDNHFIYQWPLGVATYRNFPNPDFSKLNLQISRSYVCNFIATIYPDSSRQELLKVLESEKFRNICFVKPRFEWQPKESRDSLNLYVEALRLSDLTLSPIGMNHECYRIYEAMAFGSVPVIEESLNHVMKSSCDHKNTFRLLKQNKAPFIYVTNWTLELPLILQNELNLSLEFKIKRRIQLVNWYQNFKTSIRNTFIDVMNEKFF